MQEIGLTSGKNNLPMPDRAITLMVDKDTFFNLKFTCIYWTLNWLIYRWTVDKHKWHDIVMDRYDSDRKTKWEKNYLTFLLNMCTFFFSSTESMSCCIQGLRFDPWIKKCQPPLTRWLPPGGIGSFKQRSKDINHSNAHNFAAGSPWRFHIKTRFLPKNARSWLQKS